MTEERNEVFRKIWFNAVYWNHGLFQVGEMSWDRINPDHPRKEIPLEEFIDKINKQFYAKHGNVFYAPKEDILWFPDIDSREIYTLKLPS